MIKKTGDTLYVGVDESNHGRFPEIFVAVASFNYQDSLISSNQKNIRKEPKLLSSLKIRDYRYTIVSKNHYQNYGGKNIMPLVSSKLIQNFNIPYDFLKLFIDGEFKRDQKRSLEHLLKNKIDLPIQSLLIKPVPKGEPKSTNYIISLADGFANWICKNLRQNRITRGMEKRKVVFE